MDIRIVTNPADALGQLQEALSEQNRAADRLRSAVHNRNEAEKEQKAAHGEAEKTTRDVALAREWLDYTLGGRPEPRYCSACDSMTCGHSMLPSMGPYRR